MKIIFANMMVDLFHFGHVNFRQRCKELGDFLTVGLHNDDVVTKYKRKPAMSLTERAEWTPSDTFLILFLKYVEGTLLVVIYYGFLKKLKLIKIIDLK